MSFWDLDDPLEGAVLDGHLWSVPASAAHNFALYLDEPLAWALGVHPSRKATSDALTLRVAALREAVWETMAAHDIPELHKAVPFAVNGRSEPTDWRFVAIVRQEGAFWLTVIRAQPRTRQARRTQRWRPTRATAFLARAALSLAPTFDTRATFGEGCSRRTPAPLLRGRAP